MILIRFRVADRWLYGLWRFGDGLGDVGCLHLLCVVEVTLMCVLQDLLVLHPFILLKHCFHVAGAGLGASFDSEVRPVDVIVVC